MPWEAALQQVRVRMMMRQPEAWVHHPDVISAQRAGVCVCSQRVQVQRDNLSLLIPPLLG